MIQFPKKSVTRFFIPLIDVTTLLFCIFLLMPMVKPTGEGSDLAKLADVEEKIRQEQERLAKLQAQGQAPTEEQMQKLRALQAELERQRTLALQQRLVVRVLEIDADTGKLYFRAPERVEIRNEADAHDLIDKDRQARAGDKRELYYLILFPRGGPGTFPTKAQRAAYRDWFKDVALGWDIPGVDTVPGGMP
jgi:hypothetical protein